MLRTSASADAECRASESRANARISGVEPGDRVHGLRPGREVRVVERVLGAQQYGELGKRDRGVVRAYLEK